MKLQVKFDFIHNMEKQMEDATKEELRELREYREYRENKEEFLEELVESFKQALKIELNYDDYCWIENLDVKVVEKWII